MKLILSLAALLLASSASAQTPAEVLQSHNNGVCLEAGLAAGCTDAAVLAAYCADKPTPCVDARAADAKVYSTATAFRDAVILPGRFEEVFDRRSGRVIERLNQLVSRKSPLYDRVKCVAIFTAAGLDTSVCK